MAKQSKPDSPSKRCNYAISEFSASYSLFAAGKYPDCIDLCKQVLKDFSNNDLNGNIYTNYASALDAQGQSKEAIKVYTEGIRKFPHEHLLFFNRGITEYNQNDHDAAAKDLEESLRLSPGHAGSHQALAFCVYDNNRIAGALALATFLMVEPTGPRAEKNLATLTQLLHKNVSQTNDSNVTITLSADDLNTKPKGDDNFHQAELMLSLTGTVQRQNGRGITGKEAGNPGRNYSHQKGVLQQLLRPLLCRLAKGQPSGSCQPRHVPLRQKSLRSELAPG
jgi:tetratricopeptide (TPR) repeat protein